MPFQGVVVVEKLSAAVCSLYFSFVLMQGWGGAGGLPQRHKVTQQGAVPLLPVLASVLAERKGLLEQALDSGGVPGCLPHNEFVFWVTVPSDWLLHQPQSCAEIQTITKCVSC